MVTEVYFIKNRYKTGKFVPSAKNLADILTKVLPRPQFIKLDRTIDLKGGWQTLYTNLVRALKPINKALDSFLTE